MKIVVVEDDADIGELLVYNFGQEGWDVTHKANGQEGLNCIQQTVPDLVILDLMLPDLSGLDVCRALKSSEATKNIPLIMLTAKAEEVDRIVGFELGADDYVAKPFSPRELVLRAKALYNRSNSKNKTSQSESEQPIIKFGVLQIDLDRYEVRVNEKIIKLTSLEFKILKFLHKGSGRVATREILLEKVWGYNSDLTTRTVDTHIKRLREKLEQAGDYIETVRGVGYRFKDNP